MQAVLSGCVNSFGAFLMVGLIAAAISCSTESNRNTGDQTSARSRRCGPFGDAPADTIESEKPFCLEGERLGPWKDADGTDRYACLYEPDQRSGPVPLVVFLHPSLFGTETIHLTNLLHYQDSFPLGADARGFIVLEPTGRKTNHYYPFPDTTSIGWDNWYRQLSPAGDVKLGGTIYKQNVDAAAIDHFIAQEVATGKVDATRVYVTGWSNGSAMAYLYALNRPNIAAAAIYSAPDPYGAFDDPCRQKPVARPPKDGSEVQIFNPGLPNLHIHSNCDVAGICPNCEQLTSELTAAGVIVDDVIDDSLGGQVSKCMHACGADPEGDADPLLNPLAWSLGVANHSRWPLSWTRTMLEFLRDHPLNPKTPISHP